MFPRISKFSNLSTTSGNTSQTTQQSTQNPSVAAKRNDSSNIRNLLFGGYEEPTPQKQMQVIQPQIDISQSLGKVEVFQQQQTQVIANMDDIECKINNKLQEIESLFNDRNGSAVSGQRTSQNPLVQGALNQLELKQIPLEEQDFAEEIKKPDSKKASLAKNDKKTPQKPRQNSIVAPDKKQAAINKVVRQNSVIASKQQPRLADQQKSKTNLENDNQMSNSKSTPNQMQVKLTNQNKLPPRNQPIKLTENQTVMKQTQPSQQFQQLNQDLEESLPSQSMDTNKEFDNSYVYQMERQLQLKTSENTKLKKKVALLEKQIEAKKQENEKQLQLQGILSKEGQIENTDERRIMILKAQNGQLTKHNAYLNEVLKAHKKIMIEVDHVLSDLTMMCKGLDITKIESKLPDILNNVTSMQKRLKSSNIIEQKEFNCHRFEEENPYYITQQAQGTFGKYDDEEKPQNFQLNREKILNTEQKLSLLLENALELYERCFSKKKPPNSNQFLRFCEDVRQSIEALLLLGIAINPDQSEGSSVIEASKDRKQALKDYVDKKLSAKIELDKHILDKKLTSESCKIVNKDMLKHLNEIVLQNNTKKNEKMTQLNHIIGLLQNSELTYVAEIYLKQTQINLLRAQYSKLFSHMSSLKQWFRQKVSNILIQQLRDNLYDKFVDLENILLDSGEDDRSSQVKLWSVFNMHYKDMKGALDKVLSVQQNEFPSSDTYLDSLAKVFEERVTEAREIVLNWS